MYTIMYTIISDLSTFISQKFTTFFFISELGLKDAESLDCRPDIEHVKKTFHTSTTIALAGGIGISVFLVIIWPVIMVGVGTLEKMGFFVWVCCLI